MASVSESLLFLFALKAALSVEVTRTHTCTFEPPGGVCGWSLPDDLSVSAKGIASAQHPPPLGPTQDVNPGTSNGHYVYYWSNRSLSVAEQVLVFPSHQYICGLSFSYYSTGPLELDVVRENMGVDTVSLSTSQGVSPSSWEVASYQYNISLYEAPSSGSALYFEVSEFDMGEAPLESDNLQLLLALDNVTLTFCLPCDYDAFMDPGTVILGAPDSIDIQLRISSSYQFNASTPACPNETLVFTIQSVVPISLLPLFSLDASTGVLTVNATGPHLDANGTSGFLNVSVHVSGSNYTQQRAPHGTSVSIPFHQPPTINQTAPFSLPFNISASFLYEFATSSELGLQLTFGQLQATPVQLRNNVSMTVLSHDVGVRVTGTVSILHTLPYILQQEEPPSLSLAISDSLGGVVIARTELSINPSPPLFDRSEYVFTLAEGLSGGTLLGPIRLIEPNRGDLMPTPVVITPEDQPRLFAVVPTHLTSSEQDPSDDAFSSFQLFTSSQFNYEVIQSVTFSLQAVDHAHPSLSSSATVTVNISPVNEFAPTFLVNRIEVQIAEDQPLMSLVAMATAIDGDAGADGIIDYVITAGNSDGYFALSGMGFGEVVVQRTPINPHTYTLIVTASDRGTPPRSSNITVLVHVAATSDIDCMSANYAPPMVTSSSPPTQVLPVGSNVTLLCGYTANPAVRGYKWLHNRHTLLPGGEDPHYVITNTSLTIGSLNMSDGGLFRCNVTNQCGSSAAAFLLYIIAPPNPPRNVRQVSPPSPRTLVLSWDVPDGASLSLNSVLNTPVTSYSVQFLREGGTGVWQNAFSEPLMGTTTASLHDLYPGSEYRVRVLAENSAGATASQPINITTNASVPSLMSLRASALENNSIMVEWELEYDGGHPLTLLEVHVTLHGPRPPHVATPTPPDLVYHVMQGGTGRLVTRGVDPGHTYTTTAVATNILGPSMQMRDNVFVGHTTLTSCGFEGGRGQNCVWSLQEGTTVRASDATPPLPSTDASNMAEGYYAYVEVSGVSERVLMTLPRAGYVCGITFSYVLSGEGTGEGVVSAMLRTTSGQVLWSSSAPSGVWTGVGLSDSRYLTTSVDDELVLMVVSAGRNGSLALDDIHTSFCLPCNFEGLSSTSTFDLNYENYSRIYLRTPQVISILAVMEACPGAVLNVSIARIVPTAIDTSFSAGTEDGRNISLHVEPISPSRVEPNSLGLLEVVVSVMNSDYLSPGGLVSRVAMIEFLLTQQIENCSFSSSCGFEAGESGCGLWTVGEGVRVTETPKPIQNTFTGRSLYAVSANTHMVLTSALIDDDFCSVSFSYAVSSSIELVLRADGLGSVWSSLASPGTTGWTNLTVQLDLLEVPIQRNRSLWFEGRLRGNRGDSALNYAALDNLTLTPCMDCDTPVCTLTSCVPGHYYSLDASSCMDCPPGHYCPDWRIFPKPCPPGTFSSTSAAMTRDTCMTCPASTFAVQAGSTTCQTCPAGFDCSNASSIPMATGVCDTTGHSAHVPGVTVGLSVSLAVVVGVCLLVLLVGMWWCTRREKRLAVWGKRTKKRRRHQGNQSSGLNLSMVRKGKHLKSMTSRGGDSVRTLTSFLSDDDNANYLEDMSWMDTEKLTTPTTQQHHTLQNANFDDTSAGESEHHLELKIGENQLMAKLVPDQTTSNF